MLRDGYLGNDFVVGVDVLVFYRNEHLLGDWENGLLGLNHRSIKYLLIIQYNINHQLIPRLLINNGRF
jgi:hypothetical protein